MQSVLMTHELVMFESLSAMSMSGMLNGLGFGRPGHALNDQHPACMNAAVNLFLTGKGTSVQKSCWTKK
jgi:hypothetical protein